MNDHEIRGQGERYVAKLDSLFGARAVTHELAPQRAGAAPVIAAVYENVPTTGHVTGFTYGLSLSDRQPGRELCITMRSDNPQWAMVPARMVSALWGLSDFGYGSAFGNSRTLVEGSAMNSILIADPPESLGGIVNRVGSIAGDGGEEGEVVEINGVYPIHASERDFIRQHGFEAFWALEWDRADPSRPTAV